MSVRTKLFAAMSAFILVMSLLFVLITQFVVRGILNYTDLADRSRETGILITRFQDFYESHNRSWEGVNRFHIGDEWHEGRQDAAFRLLSPGRTTLHASGTPSDETVIRLGIRKNVTSNGEAIAQLYYYDSEVANVSKIRLGINSSVTFLLLAGTVLLAVLALVVAYGLSKRLTRPLRQLIPVIERLGQGEFGVTAPVLSQDEYGKVAGAFNEMSLQLEQAETVRKNLTADVAHELRTPLTILRGHLELIQQSGRSVEPESLLPLQDELIRLSRLVDDLHQLSLAEAGKLPLERKPMDAAALLQRIVERVEPDARSKSVSLALVNQAELPMIRMDPNRMTQVFLNLLMNAVRYTPPGGSITVTVADGKPHPPNDKPDRIRITVTDTGPGIDQEHLPFIFNRFYRTEEARARNSGGMGLGLSIAKQFVVAHHGTIEAESSPGHGTSFHIILPYQ